MAREARFVPAVNGCIIRVGFKVQALHIFPEAGLEDWISVADAAAYTGYSDRHIRYLLATGQLAGRKFGRDWFTTKQALDAYLSTDPKPGPEPKKQI